MGLCQSSSDHGVQETFGQGMVEVTEALSLSLVRMGANALMMTTGLLSSGSAGGTNGGRGNGQRAGLPSTFPRKVRSLSPVSKKRSNGNAYRRKQHDANVGRGCMKKD